MRFITLIVATSICLSVVNIHVASAAKNGGECLAKAIESYQTLFKHCVAGSGARSVCPKYREWSVSGVIMSQQTYDCGDSVHPTVEQRICLDFSMKIFLAEKSICNR